jgi:hypothetical protein
MKSKYFEQPNTFVRGAPRVETQAARARTRNVFSAMSNIPEYRLKPWETKNPLRLRKSLVNATCGCLLCFLLFLYVAGNIFVIGYVHWQMVYLQPNGSPGLQQSAVYYYNYIDVSKMPAVQFLNSSNITPANYLSGVSLALYGEDLARFIVPLLAAGWVMLAVPCNTDSTTLPIVIIVIFALYDLGKFIYFILVNQSTFTTTQCSEYPFCVSHDSSASKSTPDVTFTAELWANAAFFVFSIIIAVVLSFAVEKNRAYEAARSADPTIQARCDDCGQKMQNIAGRHMGTADSDSDDGRPLPVREQETLIVDDAARSTRRRTTSAKKIGHDIPRIFVPDADDSNI